MADTFLLVQAIERELRALLTRNLTTRDPNWWSRVPIHIRQSCERYQRLNAQPEVHPIEFASLSQLLDLVERYGGELFPSAGDLRALLRQIVPVRDNLAHGRDIDRTEGQQVRQTAQRLLSAMPEHVGNLHRALDYAIGSGLGQERRIVFMPALELNDPLQRYYGFTSVLQRQGFAIDLVREDEVPAPGKGPVRFTLDEYRSRLERCSIIWIATEHNVAFLGKEGTELLLQQVLRGKPTLLNVRDVQRLPCSEEWSLLSSKLGLAWWPHLRLVDSESYDSIPDIPIFKKENECLRDAFLFSGVDQVTIGMPQHIGGGKSLARRVVVGGPKTQVLNIYDDEWTSIRGGEACCMAVATHSVIPAFNLRVLAISGDAFHDPYEDLGGAAHHGISRNVAFAINAINWLLL